MVEKFRRSYYPLTCIDIKVPKANELVYIAPPHRPDTINFEPLFNTTVAFLNAFLPRFLLNILIRPAKIFCSLSRVKKAINTPSLINYKIAIDTPSIIGQFCDY
jgi:hypothetical protein